MQFPVYASVQGLCFPSIMILLVTNDDPDQNEPKPRLIRPSLSTYAIKTFFYDRAEKSLVLVNWQQVQKYVWETDILSEKTALLELL